MANQPPKNPRKSRYTMSAVALASMRANLEKARAAGHEKIYRPTEKRMAASRTNMAKAIAARKSAGGNASARLNALSHGLFVRDVARSVRRMGEDPAEFREHHKLFFRIFAPQDDEERAWVQRIADINWKRLRYFRAMAVWELNSLKIGFYGVRREKPISSQETERRVAYLSRLLTRYVNHMDPIMRFQARMDREIRKLLLKRSGGKTKYPVYRVKKEPEDPLEAMLDKMLEDGLGGDGENRG